MQKRLPGHQKVHSTATSARGHEPGYIALASTAVYTALVQRHRPPPSPPPPESTAPPQPAGHQPCMTRGRSGTSCEQRHERESHYAAVHTTVAQRRSQAHAINQLQAGLTCSLTARRPACSAPAAGSCVPSTTHFNQPQALPSTSTQCSPHGAQHAQRLLQAASNIPPHNTKGCSTTTLTARRPACSAPASGWCASQRWAP